MSTPPRLHVALSFVEGARIALPAGAARHVQVLRLQPGQALVLFNGSDDAEWPAEVAAMTRTGVDVTVVGPPHRVDRELAASVTIAVGITANDRMDALVEKASELGAAAIQPLECTRAVVRLAPERAAARREHWQRVAVAASEQCGRVRVTEIAPVARFGDWLASLVAAPNDATASERRWLASLSAAALPIDRALAARPANDGDPAGNRVVALSGPEGGLTDEEERAAVDAGFVRLGLGPRVLRADTAPLFVLAAIGSRGLS